MAMLEIVVSGIGCSSFQISPDSFGTLNSKIPQVVASSFPELEIGYLDQILYHSPGMLSPQSGRAHNNETYGLFCP